MYWFVEDGKLQFNFEDDPIVLSSDPAVVRQAQELLLLRDELDGIIPPVQQKEII
jgi:hypothetical protein